MLRLGGKKHLSVLKMTFRKKNVHRISLEYTDFFSDSFYWRATVRFKNGDSSGSQKFKNKDFDAIMSEINSFIESLS